MEGSNTVKTRFTSAAVAALAFVCLLAGASKDAKDWLNYFSMACFALALPILMASIAIEESLAKAKNPTKAKRAMLYWQTIGVVFTAFGLAFFAFTISPFVGGALCLGFAIAIVVLFYAGVLGK